MIINHSRKHYIKIFYLIKKEEILFYSKSVSKSKNILLLEAGYSSYDSNWYN